MLMRTDPFREIDHFAQQMLGSASRPAAMPIDAFRQGEEFVVQFDLPGVARTRLMSQSSAMCSRCMPSGGGPSARTTSSCWSANALTERSAASCFSATRSTLRISRPTTPRCLVLRIPVREQAKARKIQIASEQSRNRSAVIDATSQPEPDAIAPVAREASGGEPGDSGHRLPTASPFPDDTAPLYTVGQVSDRWVCNRHS